MRRWRPTGIAALAALAVLPPAGWAVFWLVYNPRVPLEEPVVIERPLVGDTIDIALAGDFAPTDAAMPLIERHGWRYPYLATAQLLQEAELAFANLEAPVTDSDDRFPGYKKYSYRVSPAAVEAWQWLGLDVVSLANNHIRDYQAAGVLDTVRHLDAAGIAHVGAGADETAARRPVIVDVGGTRIGLLAYVQHKTRYNLHYRLYAIGGRAGAAQLNPADLEEDVRRLRPLVDVLIVSVHWGDNYAPVTRVQEEYARRLVDLGADVVAGHHPHDVQAVETRGDAVILYSLGNYAWGAVGAPALRVGLIARVQVRPRRGAEPARVEQVDLVPIATQNRLVRYQPRPLAPAERGWLRPLLDASAARGTRLEIAGAILRVVR